MWIFAWMLFVPLMWAIQKNEIRMASNCILMEKGTRKWLGFKDKLTYKDIQVLIVSITSLMTYIVHLFIH